MWKVLFFQSQLSLAYWKFKKKLYKVLTHYVLLNTEHCQIYFNCVIPPTTYIVARSFLTPILLSCPQLAALSVINHREPYSQSFLLGGIQTRYFNCFAKEKKVLFESFFKQIRRFSYILMTWSAGDCDLLWMPFSQTIASIMEQENLEQDNVPYYYFEASMSCFCREKGVFIQ